MHLPVNAPSWLRRMLPTSLFGRALLIVVVPILLVQLVSAYLFYARHWDNVSRYLANSVAGEVIFITQAWPKQRSEGERTALAESAGSHLGIAMKWRDLRGSEPPYGEHASEAPDKLFADVQAQLATRLGRPFWIERTADDEFVRILVSLPRTELSFMVPKKRLMSATLEVWLVGNAVVMLIAVLVAVLFLRNQVRPIVALARAADRFGRGQDMPGFHPHGAREVRLAAHAFLTMKERIRRMLASRTEMLAAISHDVRTPLTRMKLQVEMLPEGTARNRLAEDVRHMERMIEEYLDFVRLDALEPPQRTDLRNLLTAVCTESEPAAQLVADESAELSLRPRAFERAVRNLIENAQHYGTQCRVTLSVSPSLISIHVEDNGPGIPEEQRERMFLPFTRGDEARNLHHAGAGLGLSIVREIVHQHGGRVHLASSDDLGGLRATIAVPR